MTDCDEAEAQPDTSTSAAGGERSGARDTEGATGGSEAVEGPDTGEQLEHGLPTEQIAGHSIFNGPAYIGTLNSSGQRGQVLLWWRLRHEFGTPPPSFVEPPHFGELVRLLREEQVAIVLGADCGSVTTAAAALRACGHRPILELPPAPTPRDLLEALAHVLKTAPKAGIVVPCIGEKLAQAFTGSEMRRLRGLLGGGSAVALTARSRPPSGAPAYELPSVEATPPDPARIIRAHSPTESTVCSRALEALDVLLEDGPVAPGMAVELVSVARREITATPRELAGLVAGRSDAIDEWLLGRPTAEQVAPLCVAATLDGVPTIDVDLEAANFRRRLEGEVEPSDEPKQFGYVDPGWPSGIVAANRRVLPTYFGLQLTEITEICPPYRREKLVAQLWDKLGGEFRQEFLRWLGELSRHSSPLVRSGASVTTGVLFALDAVTVERELLRPWAADGSGALRECTALSLGVPVLLGEDPAPARALVHAWTEGSGRARELAAIAAYGGPLGVWDSGAGASAQLWQIAERSELAAPAESGTRGLSLTADRALAGLTAAGTEASLSRETALSLVALQAKEGNRAAKAHAFRLLPVMMRRLTRGDTVARQSFTALVGETEQQSFSTLTGVLAHALDSPTGFEPAHEALALLLDAVGAGRSDLEVARRLIRGMKAGAAEGRRAALGQQLDRVLSLERREDGRRGEVAGRLYKTFFLTSQEVLPSDG